MLPTSEGSAPHHAPRTELEESADTAKLALRAFLENWGAVFGDDYLMASECISRLYPKPRSAEAADVQSTVPSVESPELAAMREAVEALCNGRPDSPSLGRMFRSNKGRVIGGRMLDGKSRCNREVVREDCEGYGDRRDDPNPKKVSKVEIDPGGASLLPLPSLSRGGRLRGLPSLAFMRY